jgi:hypothetical protein
LPLGTSYPVMNFPLKHIAVVMAIQYVQQKFDVWQAAPASGTVMSSTDMQISAFFQYQFPIRMYKCLENPSEVCIISQILLKFMR